ncbi:biotin transporter BioY [Bacillus sp. SL00103]
MIVYALVGIAGAPVFAQFSAGFGVILGKSGGFCLIVYSCCLASWIHLKKKKNPGFGCFYLQLLLVRPSCI